MRIRAPRSRLTVAAALIAVGAFSLAANLTAGLEPDAHGPIPDSAFQPVTVPSVDGRSVAAGSLNLPPADASAGSLLAPSSSEDLPVLRDPATSTAPPERPQPAIRVASPIVVPIVPKTTHAISGNASWYCRAGISPCTYGHPDDGGVDAYAAAGPRLRAAIGSDWRGAIVYVDGVRVQLIDWCQCYEGQSNEKLLDLYYDVFAKTGSPVTVRW